MGLFNRLFSTSDASENQHSKLDWVALNSIAQLDEIESLPAGKKAMIFKHSTRCGISSMVLKQFEKSHQSDDNTVLYYLDLLENRDISDDIATRFQVIHQSPQLLIIENGKCTSHASHHQILSMT